jgi:hypothetical protein
LKLFSFVQLTLMILSLLLVARTLSRLSLIVLPLLRRLLALSSVTINVLLYLSTVKVNRNIFCIQDQDIPSLAAEESYRYLGVPISMIHNINDLDAIVPQITEDLAAIHTSLHPYGSMAENQRYMCLLPTGPDVCPPCW